MTTRRLSAFVVEDDLLDPGEGLSNALREVQAERGQRAQRTAEQEAEAEQRTLTIARWLDLVPETHGPIDLANFAFQREPFYSRPAVDDREQVMEKATQAGASAGMIRVALFSADVRQRNVLYTFPTAAELGPFSQSRFGPIIRGSERLTRRIRQDDGAKVENVFAKRFGSDGWCFGAGTMVLTRRGHVPIEEVVVGDEVLTHRRRWRRVRKVMSRQAPTTLVVRGQGVPDLVTTPEHPVYVRTREPRRVVGPAPRQRATPHGAPEWLPAGALADGGRYVGQLTPPTEDDDHSEDFWWLVGRYLADGWIQGDASYPRVALCCALHEADELAERIARVFPGGHRRERGPVAEFQIGPGGTDFARFLEPFGRLAHGKRLTASALALPQPLARALLDGYLSGDGHFREQDQKWLAATTSRALALGLALLTQRAYGIVASVWPQRTAGTTATFEGGRQCKRRMSYAILIARRNASAFIETDIGWRLIRSVRETGARRVWNLEVQDDESFLADNCIVHNCFLRGTEKPIESLPIDMLIADEFNYSNLEHLADSEYRVTGPKSLGLIRRLGVPTIPGFGVSRYYLDSDQRGWTVKCEGCGEQNRLQGFEAFRDNVDIEGVRLVCRKPDCRHELDVRKGEWVAKHPERDVKGYNVPKLLMPSKRVLAGVIARSRRTRPKDKERFLNRDLGVAWAPEEGRLSLEQVQACQRPELRPVDPWAVVPPSSYLRVMGVDMASTRALNVTIEEKIGTDPDDLRALKLWMGEVQDDPARGSAFQQVCRLIDIFGIYMVGIDNNPDGRFGIALAARYPGRVYRIQFFEPGAAGRSAPKEWTVNDAESFVSLHRTIAYDSTFSRFRTQQVLLPPLETLPEDYAEHLGSLYRQKTEDGAKVSVSYVVTGDHDYAQAEAYCLAALELYWRRVGLGIALDPTPTPLRDLDPYAPVEDDEEQGVLAGLPRYRSGFE